MVTLCAYMTVTVQLKNRKGKTYWTEQLQKYCLHVVPANSIEVK